MKSLTWFSFPNIVSCIPKILVYYFSVYKKIILLHLLIASNIHPQEGCWNTGSCVGIDFQCYLHGSKEEKSHPSNLRSKH